MANFLVAVDADLERRESFINLIQSELALVDGLVPGDFSYGEMRAVWAAESRAPVSQVADDAGAALLWGDAVGGEDSGRIDATTLRSMWGDSDRRDSTVLNGFFAGVVYQPEIGLIVGGDLLGVFPLYYYSGPDFLLVGSSPELFSRHPAFTSELNPAGLVGILLTMHCIDGQTLLKSVKRLAAGHLLIKPPESQATEHLQYRLPVSTKYFSLPFSAHVDMLDDLFNRQLGRQMPDKEEYSFLLSGGLDSRLLAGYLEKNNTKTVALTLGVPEDIEMQCAVGVARSLKFRHCGIDIPFSEYPEYAETQVKWEHLTNGFNNCMEWGLYPHLRKNGRRVVMGHMLDAVIGTRYINWAYSVETGCMSFDNFFTHANSWGYSPDVLKKLLRREVFGELVDETVERLRSVYEGYSDLESQRAWCFNLHHRQRFHVGSSAWACSFGAWPVVPALDDGFLSWAGGMPAATIAERRAQIELLCERFPQLAALPLDRNSYHTRPLRPRLRYLLGQALRKPLSSFRRQTADEKRFYVRVFDVNGSGWQSIRHQAEENREQLESFFNMDILNQLLPGPAAPIHLKNEIIDSSGLKSLLGLMLWSKRHL